MAPITDLPVELVERIVCLLTIEEVGNLRLTSREICAKASQGEYLTYFVNHNVDLSEPSLKALTKVLSEDNLSRRLRHLTITTLVFDDHNDKSPILPFAPDWEPPLLSNRPRGFCVSDSRGTAALQERAEARQQSSRVNLRRAQHEVNVECNVYPSLLQEAFELMRLHCQDGLLDSLRLTCKVDVGDGPHLDIIDKDARLNYLSSHTTYLFSITMDALLGSGLQCQCLNIFANTRHCSIASTQLSVFLARADRSALRRCGPWTSSVKSLALSFSRLTDSEAARVRDMCCSCNQRKLRPTGEKTICHKHLIEFDDEDDPCCQHDRRVTTFLSCFANLETLDLHQYEIERSTDKWNPVVFEHIAEDMASHKLKKLSLRGINVDETSILAVLSSQLALQSLIMRHINLKEGQWQPVLGHIKTMSNLRFLHLEDLFENKRADSVSVPGQRHHINVPPPPPPLHGFGGGLPPPPLPPATIQTESYLNTLLAFRVMNAPEDEVHYSGAFKHNRVVLENATIANADILYGFIAHQASKWRLEKKWMAESTREYGPRPRDIFDLDY